jgi:hypothetical protein
MAAAVATFINLHDELTITPDPDRRGIEHHPPVKRGAPQLSADVPQKRLVSTVNPYKTNTSISSTVYPVKAVAVDSSLPVPAVGRSRGAKKDARVTAVPISYIGVGKKIHVEGELQVGRQLHGWLPCPDPRLAQRVVVEIAGLPHQGAICNRPFSPEGGPIFRRTILVGTVEVIDKTLG